MAKKRWRVKDKKLQHYCIQYDYAKDKKKRKRQDHRWVDCRKSKSSKRYMCGRCGKKPYKKYELIYLLVK